ncbi:hypothetical protein C8F01DRAFT_1230222 [Mycena amicta]|nr:hypothetical protein C8F01DRAFT_1230222 [Mycena amicta]
MVNLGVFQRLQTPGRFNRTLWEARCGFHPHLTATGNKIQERGLVSQEPRLHPSIFSFIALSHHSSPSVSHTMGGAHCKRSPTDPGFPSPWFPSSPTTPPPPPPQPPPSTPPTTKPTITQTDPPPGTPPGTPTSTHTLISTGGGDSPTTTTHAESPSTPSENNPKSIPSSAVISQSTPVADVNPSPSSYSQSSAYNPQNPGRCPARRFKSPLTIHSTPVSPPPDSVFASQTAVDAGGQPTSLGASSSSHRVLVSRGAIAGSVVGVVVVLLISGIAIFLYKRRKSRKFGYGGDYVDRDVEDTSSCASSDAPLRPPRMEPLRRPRTGSPMSMVGIPEPTIPLSEKPARTGTADPPTSSPAALSEKNNSHLNVRALTSPSAAAPLTRNDSPPIPTPTRLLAIETALGDLPQQQREEVIAMALARVYMHRRVCSSDGADSSSYGGHVDSVEELPQYTRIPDQHGF